MRTYRYSFQTFEVDSVTVNGDPNQPATIDWIEEQLNEIGARGQRALNFELSTAPGRVLVNQQHIPRTVLRVYIETEIPTARKEKT